MPPQNHVQGRPGGCAGHPSGAARCPPASVRLGSRRNRSKPSPNGSRPRARPGPAARLVARLGADCSGDRGRRDRAVDPARFSRGAGLGRRAGGSLLADLPPAADSGVAARSSGSWRRHWRRPLSASFSSRRLVLLGIALARESHFVVEFIGDARHHGIPPPVWIGQLPIIGASIAEWWRDQSRRSGCRRGADRPRQPAHLDGIGARIWRRSRAPPRACCCSRC